MNLTKPMNRFVEHLATYEQTVGAVVLAGGLARRMGGQDKGLIQLADRPMAAWVVDAIKPSVSKLIINANRNHDAYAKMGVAVVADTQEGFLGPLAGLSAGIDALQCDYVFMCPCDSPFLTAELLDRLGFGCLEAGADIAVAYDGKRLQPVFCMVKSSLRESLNAFLQSGERKIDRWFASEHTVEIDCSDLTSAFENINTEEERLKAEAGLSDDH